MKIRPTNYQAGGWGVGYHVRMDPNDTSTSRTIRYIPKRMIHSIPLGNSAPVLTLYLSQRVPTRTRVRVDLYTIHDF